MSVDNLIELLKGLRANGQGHHPVLCFDPDCGGYQEVTGLTGGGKTVELYTDE